MEEVNHGLSEGRRKFNDFADNTLGVALGAVAGVLLLALAIDQGSIDAFTVVLAFLPGSTIGAIAGFFVSHKLILCLRASADDERRRRWLRVTTVALICAVPVLAFCAVMSAEHSASPPSDEQMISNFTANKGAMTQLDHWSADSNEMDFEFWVTGYAFTDVFEKGYSYLDVPPNRVLPSLDDYGNGDESYWKVYRSIGGHWYLYYEHIP